MHGSHVLRAGLCGKFLRVLFGVLLVLVAAACTASAKTLPPGQPCQVTLPEPSTFLGGFGPVAGGSPVWTTVANDGLFAWEEMGPDYLAPYPGRAAKQVWVLAPDVQGTLRITGRQLDGDGRVLFPNGEVQWVSETSVTQKDKPLEALVIDTATDEHQAPPYNGYRFFTSSLLYPHPGCYELTASIGENQVNVIIEVR